MQVSMAISLGETSMLMLIVEGVPITCTLTPGVHTERLLGSAALNRDALRSHVRRDLVLELRYAPEARDRVLELVRKERGLLWISGLRSPPNRR